MFVLKFCNQNQSDVVIFSEYLNMKCLMLGFPPIQVNRLTTVLQNKIGNARMALKRSSKYKTAVDETKRPAVEPTHPYLPIVIKVENLEEDSVDSYE